MRTKYQMPTQKTLAQDKFPVHALPEHHMKVKLELMFMKHYAPNRCEPSIEVIMKMGVQWEEGWVGRGGSGFEGCQGGCERERRIEVIVKIKKKNRGRGGQVRMD